jgi:hypothetical protein
MHRAYASAWLASFEVVELDPDGVPLDPHPATVSQHAAARLRMGKRIMCLFYRRRDHTDVTTSGERPADATDDRCRATIAARPRPGRTERPGRAQMESR